MPSSSWAVKILELRLKNLNSLYGEWVIDFTAPEYLSDGIFALTGPTGAGKSTILDAICLALYGATPRLGKITKSSNELMSRQTSECYAEVLFESQAGLFRCHWEQRRARKKAAGKLQDQEHQIAEGKTGKLIETKKSLVPKVIEEKTGMDFDRFTRSILLAQGGFDTFLKANIEQKSKILEQITGTEIYSDISRRVHERQREEREKLNLLVAETAGIVLLKPEEEKEVIENLCSKQKQKTDAVKIFEQTGKSITWLTAIALLSEEIDAIRAESLTLKDALDAFIPERKRLEKANQAVRLEAEYTLLLSIREQLRKDQLSLDEVSASLPELTEKADAQSKTLSIAEETCAMAKAALQEASPSLIKIRLTDQKVSEREKAVSEGAIACEKAETQINTDKQLLQKELEKRSDIIETRSVIERYLKEHAEDECLVSGLAAIEERLANLMAQRSEIVQKKDEIEQSGKLVSETSKALEVSTRLSVKRRSEVQGATKHLRRSKEALAELLAGKSLREYRAEKESLLREMAYIRRIEELEDHRNRLEDGKACPLCGSTSHPFAEGNVPVPDEIDREIAGLTKRIHSAEEYEMTITHFEKRLGEAQAKLIESEKQEADAVHEKKTAYQKFSELNESSSELHEKFETARTAITQRLNPLGINEVTSENITSVLDNLKRRLKIWQDKQDKSEAIERSFSDIDREVKRLEAIIEIRSKALEEKQARQERLKKQCAELKSERQKAYGDKNPDDEESCLKKAITESEADIEKARVSHTELQQKLTATKTRVSSLDKQISEKKDELRKAESDFQMKLPSVGFSDEQEYSLAGLNHETRDELSSKAKALDKSQTELKAKQQDREKRLATERAKEVTEKSLEELKPLHQEQENSLKELRNTIAALKHRINENAASKKRIKDKQVAIDAQKTECHQWEKLHGLIGSADGKKYRNFAQGLTFELMVAHANRQLEKMTDRYLLIRDVNEPLELNVVDNYQAGEIRSTKNLSGGESFIVSLTLALGLSKMAGCKVRVDSLFLDEGFGTLDEEALEIALETLSGLYQDGKLIGVISHVSALKERIGTQIRISPISGGRSSISGPGCSLQNMN